MTFPLLVPRPIENIELIILYLLYWHWMDDELCSPVLNSYGETCSSCDEINANWLEINRIVEPRNNRQSIKAAIDVAQTDVKILNK